MSRTPCNINRVARAAQGEQISFDNCKYLQGRMLERVVSLVMHMPQVAFEKRSR